MSAGVAHAGDLEVGGARSMGSFFAKPASERSAAPGCGPVDLAGDILLGITLPARVSAWALELRFGLHQPGCLRSSGKIQFFSNISSKRPRGGWRALPSGQSKAWRCHCAGIPCWLPRVVDGSWAAAFEFRFLSQTGAGDRRALR